MMKFLTRAGLLAGLFAGAILFTTGCGQPAPVAENKEKDKGPGKADEKDDHSGWWCKPHGIPEEECSQCNEEYAKKCKDKATAVDKLKCISEQIRAWLGPFNKKGFVCRHNAVAMYWVLDSLGMSGDAEVETDKDYKHAWVSIVIDGVRYHIDPMNNCILSIDPKK